LSGKEGTNNQRKDFKTKKTRLNQKLNPACIIAERQRDKSSYHNFTVRKNSGGTMIKEAMNAPEGLTYQQKFTHTRIHESASTFVHLHV